MQKKLILSLLLINLTIMTSFLYSDEFHLVDGSIIRGSLLEETVDTLHIQNEVMGMIKVKNSDLKYEGKNYNEGIGFFYTELGPDNNSDIKKGPMLSISSAGAYDEKVSTCLDINYFYRSFEKYTDKLLHVDKSTWSSEKGIVTSNYEYSSNFIVPSIIMRLSIFPDCVQRILNKVKMFPYIGMGGGYGIGIMNYTRIDNTPFTIDNEEYSNEDIEYKTHYYGGFYYKILGGLSYKISSRAALYFEMVYQSYNFKQFLTSDEKGEGLQKEQFKITGICPSVGIRLGLF